MSIQDILTNAAALERRMLEASRRVQDEYCDNTMVPHMKRNAPWVDRPDDQRPKGLPHARELLAYVPDHPPDLLDGGRGHLITGATYGVHLEADHGSQFATIMPTVAAEGPRLTQKLREVWK